MLDLRRIDDRISVSPQIAPEDVTAIKAAEYARVARTVSEVDFDLYLHTV